MAGIYGRYKVMRRGEPGFPVTDDLGCGRDISHTRYHL